MEISETVSTPGDVRLLWAAFEQVSKIQLRPITEESEISLIDLRKVKLDPEIPRDTGFDPLQHRKPQTTISPWMAYLNLVRIAFGPGMLGIPMAVSGTGIILGGLMAVGVGILVTHTHLVLLWCLKEIARQLKIPIISYRHGFRLAMYHGPPFLHVLGKFGPCLVAMFMMLSQLGICTVFVIFTADNLRDIMDWTSANPALLTLYVPYLLLELSMKSLRRVSFVAMLANFLNAAGLIIVIYQIFVEPRRVIKYATTQTISISVAFGILLFNTSAVGVALSCERALANPRIMTSKFGVITMGIFVPSVVNAIFGIIAYWSFGGMEENVLRYIPFDEISSMIAMGVYLISVTMTYPLQCYPGVKIITEVIKAHDPNVVPSDAALRAFEYFLRPIFVTITFFIAYCVPFQGPFVAFVGTLCTTVLVLIFPALMEIGLLYPDNYGVANWKLIKNVIIVVLALILWLIGIYLCGSLIYIRRMTLKSPTLRRH